jgi:hypothetical protein
MELPADFDAQRFWKADDYDTEPPPSAELIARVEADLGYRLPAFYVALMRTRNGGVPITNSFPISAANGRAEERIVIMTISGIGYEKRSSLGGMLGSEFMVECWGFPAIGVVVADCPMSGDNIELVMLDYRACGPQGEPAVVHVDMEDDFHITPLAPSFEAFVRGLLPASACAE